MFWWFILCIYGKYMVNWGWLTIALLTFIDEFPIYIANLRYPATNDKFFAGERRYSH